MYTTLKADLKQMQNFLEKQRKPGQKLHLTFEISGELIKLSEPLAQKKARDEVAQIVIEMLR